MNEEWIKFTDKDVFINKTWVRLTDRDVLFDKFVIEFWYNPLERFEFDQERDEFLDKLEKFIEENKPEGLELSY